MLWNLFVDLLADGTMARVFPGLHSRGQPITIDLDETTSFFEGLVPCKKRFFECLHVDPGSPKRLKAHGEEDQRCPSTSVKIPGSISIISTAVFDSPGEDFRRHLDDYGYAVLGNVFPERDLREYVSLFWKAFKHIVADLDPDKAETWRFPQGFRGIIRSYGVAQSDCAWMLRENEKVHDAFACALRCDHNDGLVVSTDAMVARHKIPTGKASSWLHKAR